MPRRCAAGQLGSQLGGQVALRLPTAHRGSGELLTHPAAGDELYSQRGLEVAQIPGGAQRPIHGGEWADDAPVSFGGWTAAALGATLAPRTHATKVVTALSIWRPHWTHLRAARVFGLPVLG